MDWTGKVAFITGGATGIGFGVARAFSNAGMRLAISYRDEAQRARAARWFEDHGREPPLFVKLDVTDRAAFAQAAEEVEAHFGQVNVLVNNAGVSVFGPTDEASYADYDWIMGVNFGGVVNGLVSFLPKLKKAGPGGRVVNVSSMAPIYPDPRPASTPPRSSPSAASPNACATTSSPTASACRWCARPWSPPTPGPAR